MRNKKVKSLMMCGVLLLVCGVGFLNNMPRTIDPPIKPASVSVATIDPPIKPAR